jgi:putative glutamine amidotransferase
MVIAITDTHSKKFDFYVEWVGRVAQEAEIKRLSYKEDNAKELKKCDGLILSGGGDVHPKFYGREDFLKILDKKEINMERDEFEFKLVREALKKGIPVLGICRGLQVFNVAMGGSLLPDLDSEGHKNHSVTKDGRDRRHELKVEKGTTLHWIVESAKCEVNSAHHQAIDRVGDGLRVTAKSPDGVVEGLEWEESQTRPFLQLVQWHPERMTDFTNPGSKNLLEHFVLAVVSRAED